MHSMLWKCCGCVLACLVTAGSVSAQEATPSDPNSWLVLYNLNDADSITWANFYAGWYDIPAINLLGLDTTTAESISGTGAIDTVQAEIITPIREHLAVNPNLAARTCGILVGYRVPGIYGSSPYGGPGGLSTANLLQDLSTTAKQANPDCDGFASDIPPPVMKSTLGEDRFVVGWLDAPTVDTAVWMTLKAEVISSPEFCMPDDQYVYYDPCDPHLYPTWWRWLEDIADPVKGRNYDKYSEIPWMRFDADVDSTPRDVFRFGTHDVASWNDGRLHDGPAGARILAFNLNSWGATTVRSISSQGGRYVPNAIDAGYAAAIGSTGEPGSLISPYPWILLGVLRDGRTLAEAVYLANPNDNWTWVCVGDPLLKVGNWFGKPCIELSSGDLNCDGTTDGFDITPFVLALSARQEYETLYAGCDWRTGDMNGDGDLDGSDIEGFVDMITGD